MQQNLPKSDQNRRIDSSEFCFCVGLRRFTSDNSLTGSFSSIDPSSFKVVAANPGDEALYKEFTALKTSK